jgi:IS5 family transposase
VKKQLALEGLRRQLDQMMPRVKQVMKQIRARIFRGNPRSEDKLLSLFEPSTEVIRKGKAGKPKEFGKVVTLQEAENQIVGLPRCGPPLSSLLAQYRPEVTTAKSSAAG